MTSRDFFISEETWRDVFGFPLYVVSDQGRIANRETGQILRFKVHPQGYLRVNLSNDGVIKTVSVHRIVAQAFFGNIPEDLEVNHLDGDKSNNHVDNLEIATGAQNVQHAFDLGLRKPTYKPVRCLDTGEIFPSAKHAADAIGTSRNNITMAIRNKGRARGFRFELVNEDCQ